MGKGTGISIETSFIFGAMIGAGLLYASQNLKGLSLSLNDSGPPKIFNPANINIDKGGGGGGSVKSKTFLGPTAQANFAMTDVGRIGSSTAWNNSEVWDIRDRKDKNDNYLSNTMPYIPKTSISEWNPNRLNFIGSRDFDCAGKVATGMTGWIGHSGI